MKKGLSKRTNSCPICKDRGKIAVTFGDGPAAKRTFVPCAACESRPSNAWPFLAMVGILTLAIYLLWGMQ